MSDKIFLELNNITYSYSNQTSVIDGIDLNIAKGSFIGLIGPSGSGKTTLLKIITGLITPLHGTIKFNDKLLSSKNKPKIGYVPQVESVDWNFPVTVEEIVSSGIWNQSGIGPLINKHVKEKINSVLENLGLENYSKRQIRELSGGEQQRVFLARALIRKPDILVLDEPTSGVDYSARENILKKLEKINEFGITIVLTTHDISGIAKRIPWVLCLNKKIIVQGKPSDILTPENLLKIYGLTDPIDVKS